MDENGTSNIDFDKIRFCGEQARCDGQQYFWVDTCCIDKSSSVELVEAIKSMFRGIATLPNATSFRRTFRERTSTSLTSPISCRGNQHSK